MIPMSEAEEARIEVFVCLCPGSLSGNGPAHILKVRTGKVRTYAHCTLPGCGSMVVFSKHQMPSLRLPEFGGLLVHEALAGPLLVAAEALRVQLTAQPPAPGEPIHVAA